MKNIENIIEHKDILKYLISHNLLSQYKKAKNKILLWDFKSVDFRKRRPYKTEKYYFKINKQYRWFWYFKWNNFVIFEINDHQD